MAKRKIKDTRGGARQGSGRKPFVEPTLSDSTLVRALQQAWIAKGKPSLSVLMPDGEVTTMTLRNYLLDGNGGKSAHVIDAIAHALGCRIALVPL